MAGNPFWDYSLRVYARPAVKESCLLLQDRHGADVNLLLFALWLGAARGVPLTPELLAAAEAAASDWRRQVIAPLRALRRAVKAVPDAAGVHARLLDAELAAEQVAQDRLVAVAGEVLQAPGGRELATANLRALAALSAGWTGGDPAPLLERLATAAALTDDDQ